MGRSVRIIESAKEFQSNKLLWGDPCIEVDNMEIPERCNDKLIARTFVPDQPSRNAASCASNSPNPSINPLMKGSSKLIAAPRSRPQKVGGEYSIIGDLEDEGGEGERSLFEEE